MDTTTSDTTPAKDPFQKFLAASAIAFSPATDVPRKRALLQSAVSSLFSAFAEGEFTKDEAILEICRHGTLPELRNNTAVDLFNELAEQQVVVSCRDNSEYYQLSEDMISKTKEETKSVVALIARVLDDLLGARSLNPEERKALEHQVMTVLARMMEEQGTAYACQVAGVRNGGHVVDRHILGRVCKETLESAGDKAVINSEELLEAVAELFACREEHFSDFVFLLTQNYYYLRLLGMAGGLEFLSEGRFDKAEFFLDTNIVVSLLMTDSRHHKSTIELIETCKEVGCTLTVTEETISEYKWVIDGHRSSFGKIYEEMSDDLVDDVSDVFLRTYRKQHRDTGISFEAFFEEFLNPRGVLTETYNLTVEDHPVENEVPELELDKIKDRINHWSRQIRHKNKGKNAQAHDAHLYLLARRPENAGDEKIWVLTLDTSLATAFKELAGAEMKAPCMTLDGFLQVMSPYVRGNHQHSFAKLYTELVCRNLFCPKRTIDIDDFRIFTNFDLSIKALPGPDVKRIIRRVKHAIDGPLDDASREALAHEVQKALQDPTLSYRVGLEEQIAQLKRALEEKNGHLEQRNTEIETHRAKIGLMDERLQALENKQTEQEKAHVKELRRLKSEKEIQSKRAAKHTAILSGLLASLISIVLILAILFMVPASWFSIFKNPLLIRICASVVVAGIGLSLAFRKKGFTIAGIAIAVVALIISLADQFRPNVTDKEIAPKSFKSVEENRPN